MLRVRREGTSQPERLDRELSTRLEVKLNMIWGRSLENAMSQLGVSCEDGLGS